MPGYSDALFMQTEQLRFLQSPDGIRYISAFDAEMRQVEYEGDRYGELPENLTWQMAVRICQVADPIYVSPRFIEMAEHAQESFEPEIVLPTDLFTACGFAYLPKPMTVVDVHGEGLPIRAVGWVPVRASRGDGMESGGVWVMFWTHRDDDRPGLANMDEETLEWMGSRRHGSLSVIHSFWMPYNASDWENVADDSYREAARRQWTLVQVLWRLGGQVVRTVERAERHARKDAARHGVEQDHVTVIRLRKTESLVTDATPHPDDEGGDHYSVQFAVRGHWRNQWYATVKQHRQIWINGYIKGPEDAPFQPSTRVYELTR